MDQLTISCTIEDVLNFNKKDIQKYLRLNQQKVTGSKLELATRACEHIHLAHGLSVSVETTGENNQPVNNCNSDGNSVPEISELNSGWTSEKTDFPSVSHRDIEDYLINSSHRTVDRNKMECYRQYIHGYNFFKEQFIHKVMINNINDDIGYCYIRSKCYPSMKQGVYVQWILVSKEAPFTILKANCTCPAGLGEGCTHIAGLLFALDDLTENKKQNGIDNIACTSKPCEWNKPSKRNKTSKTVNEIQFKRLKYGGVTRKPKSKNAKIKTKSSCNFRERLCSKLSNTRAVLFDIIEPPSSVSTEEYVSSDLNVGKYEEVETSEHETSISDRYIDLLTTLKRESLSAEAYLNYVSNTPPEVVEELEIRTRGQSENPVWKIARHARITASNFHDIKTRKESTPASNLVKKIINENEVEISTPALKWGNKMEPIAKKRYKATKRLKFKQNVTIMEKGLFICSSCGFLGASPDGMVRTGNDVFLIEVKCPYKYHFQSIESACKDKAFCCFLDNNGNVQLKQTHRYYTQIQGQMAICNVNKCELVIYTSQDLKIIEIEYDRSFWDSLFEKLKSFYINSVIPFLFPQSNL